MINPELAKTLSHIQKIDQMYPFDTEKTKKQLFTQLDQLIKTLDDVCAIDTMYPFDTEKTKKYVFNNLPLFIKTLDDVRPIDEMYPFDTEKTKEYVFKHLTQVHTVTHMHPSVSPTTQPSVSPVMQPTLVKANVPAKSNISLLVLSGFIAVVGITAVAVALILGGPVTLAAVGLVATIVGVGLFAANVCRNNQAQVGFQMSPA